MFVNKNTCVIVQGITGTQGSLHTQLMQEFGTQIVAGVTPGKGGQKVHGVPVYNNVRQALKQHDAQWSVLFVPAPHVLSAANEATKQKLNCVIVTEHMPVHDTLAAIYHANKNNVRVIGPNCPGIVTQGCKIGIIPNDVFVNGRTGIISRSGTFLHETMHVLKQNNIGQSTAVGIGGDAVIGTTMTEALQVLEHDKRTKQIVILGEIGGNHEEHAAEFIPTMKKKVVACVVGRTAPPEKQMGHAGAIIHGEAGTAKHKIKVLEKAGVKIAKHINEIPPLL